MRKIANPNHEIKAWTQKSDLPQGNSLRYLKQPETTRKRPLELTDIE